MLAGVIVIYAIPYNKDRAIKQQTTTFLDISDTTGDHISSSYVNSD
jgi:hypothetical protein